VLTRLPYLALLRLSFVCSVEPDALLQSCLHSVHHLLRTIIRSSAAREPMFLALSRVLTFLLHSHAFVSEFFAAQWTLLHAMRDAQFEQWSVRILVELLRDSGAIVVRPSTVVHQLRTTEVGRTSRADRTRDVARQSGQREVAGQGTRERIS
jgi:hypothetical protein